MAISDIFLVKSVVTLGVKVAAAGVAKVMGREAAESAGAVAIKQAAGRGAAKGAGEVAEGAGKGTVMKEVCENGCFVAGTLVLMGDGSKQAIESIQVGQRVATDGGLSNSGQLAADANYTAVEEATWRLVTITVDDWQVQTLQPLTWLDAHALEPGDTLSMSLILDLEEMGVPEGLSGTVISIAACPEIADGNGRVVLTTVSHLNSFVFDLTLTDSSGQADTIGVTGYHKIYSQERGWINACDLRPGEEVRTAGGTATVASVVRQEGSYRIYNMTVEADHVYYVGDLSALVHNNNCVRDPDREQGAKGRRVDDGSRCN